MQHVFITESRTGSPGLSKINVFIGCSWVPVLVGTRAAAGPVPADLLPPLHKWDPGWIWGSEV